MAVCFSGRQIGKVCFFFVLWLISQGLFSQEADQSVSETLRRPDRSETPRYPEDLVIGVLGQGETPEGAYQTARNILSALAAGRRDAPVLANSLSIISEDHFQGIRSIRPKSYRLGSGRTEPDGCVSFLVRFIGNDESISGELFARQEEGRWLLDDLILEEKRPLSEIRDSYRYDFSPYERFY
jgi:hypothetical protein